MTNPLATRLKAVREARGLSLRRMQHALEHRGYEVSHDSIRHYEQGSRTIPMDYVRMMCIALDVDAAWLIFGDRAREGGAGEHKGVPTTRPRGQAQAARVNPDAAATTESDLSGRDEPGPQQTAPGDEQAGG